jgi:hypothetical protein
MQSQVEILIRVPKVGRWDENLFAKCQNRVIRLPDFFSNRPPQLSARNTALRCAGAMPAMPPVPGGAGGS